MPPNRIVALFTPVVAVAAGGAATWLADNAGLHVSEGELQAVFIGGIAAVLAPAAQWLHGFQKFESRQQDLDQAAQAADAHAAAAESPVDDDFEDEFEPDDEFEDDLEADDHYADDLEVEGDAYDDVDDDYEDVRDEADDDDDYTAARDEAPDAQPAGA